MQIWSTFINFGALSAAVHSLKTGLECLVARLTPPWCSSAQAFLSPGQDLGAFSKVKRRTSLLIKLFPEKFHPQEREFYLHFIDFGASPEAPHSFQIGFECLVARLTPLWCGMFILKRTARFLI